MASIACDGVIAMIGSLTQGWAGLACVGRGVGLQRIYIRGFTETSLETPRTQRVPEGTISGDRVRGAKVNCALQPSVGRLEPI